MANSEGFLLTLTCAVCPGIVHAISGFLVERACDIIDNRQYGDRESGRFFMRVHFTTTDPATTVDSLRDGFGAIAAHHAMEWELHDVAERPRLLLRVST